MLRNKRPRSLHSGHGHAGRARAMSEDNMGDDHLMHMDPTLMTERQQLAFLLRKTAQEQSGGDSPARPSESSDDDSTPRASKRPKKRIQNAKTSPVGARKIGSATPTEAKMVESKPLSRSRSARNSPKHEPDTPHIAKTSPRFQRASKPVKQNLHVKTASPAVSDSEEGLDEVLDLKQSVLKPSPSSTSDLTHMSVFDDHVGQVEFWSLHCALCSQSSTPYDACEPLFLCQSCDKKYPTQRALGRV